VLRGFALRGFCAWASAEAARRCGQVALEVILGFKKDAIDDALLTRCREAFRVWLQGLFSVPLDLPGFCAPCAAGSRAGWLHRCGLLAHPRAAPRPCLHSAGPGRLHGRRRLSPGGRRCAAFHRARKADRLLRGILHSNLQHLKDEAEYPECAPRPTHPRPAACFALLHHQSIAARRPSYTLPCHPCTLANRAPPCLFACAGPGAPACPAALSAIVLKSKPKRPTHGEGRWKRPARAALKAEAEASPSGAAPRAGRAARPAARRGRAPVRRTCSTSATTTGSRCPWAS